jgi:hypothetical protein
MRRQQPVGLSGLKRKFDRLRTDFGSLRVIAVAIGRKGAEIWAKQADLQPVHD